MPLAGHAAQLEQETLFRRGCTPVRAAVVPAVAVDAAKVPRVRHVGPLHGQCPKPSIVQLSQAKRQKTIEAENALVVDLSNDSD